MSDTQPTDLLVYFAATAPEDIPPWFKPNMEHLQLPEQPENVSQDSCGQFVGPEWEAWLKAKKEVEDRRAEYRYFAWRWHYAEKMKATKPARTTELPTAAGPNAGLDEVSRQLSAQLDAALGEAGDLPHEG